MRNFRVTTLGANTELLTLPFQVPLEEWRDPRIVHVPRGISRHVVRFVEAGGEVFAVKEATDRFVLREHGLLRQLAEHSVPVVEAYGTVVDRVSDTGEELGGLLITRHLQFSQPYRSLFTGRDMPGLRVRLLDALAGLFVRLHLAGFFWGDCSLSNTLFRRDAGALAAYLVDAETGELHPRLTSGQREQDIEIATMNIAGELLDLQAAGLLGEEVDVVDLAGQARSRYESLWDEVTHDVLIPPGENYLINQRLRRLNDLGFDVSELTINTEPGGMRLRFDPQVVDAGHHQRRLFELTGLRVQANQARALLSDLFRYKAKWEDGVGHAVPDDLAARRWLDEKFYATVGSLPPDLRFKLPDAELFHEINEHRWLLSEADGRDVGRAAAVDSYVNTVLRDLPDTRVDLSGPPTEEFEPIFE
ncbi:MAG TPA: DUF4032 domain-containing protein [Jatrophihabitans sp.]|nr:DUF4032 domain-containing protein [Jatrophihabitans sp.]